MIIIEDDIRNIMLVNDIVFHKEHLCHMIIIGIEEYEDDDDDDDDDNGEKEEDDDDNE